MMDIKKTVRFVLLVGLVLCAGCASSTDWSKKIGTVSYNDVLTEKGNPQHKIHLDNGDTRYVWYYESNFRGAVTHMAINRFGLERPDYYSVDIDASLFTFNKEMKLNRTDTISLHLYYPANIDVKDFDAIINPISRLIYDKEFTRENWEKMTLESLQNTTPLARHEGFFAVYQLGPFDARLIKSDNPQSHYYSHYMKGRELLMSFLDFSNGNHSCVIYYPPR